MRIVWAGERMSKILGVEMLQAVDCLRWSFRDTLIFWPSGSVLAAAGGSEGAGSSGFLASAMSLHYPSALGWHSVRWSEWHGMVKIDRRCRSGGVAIAIMWLCWRSADGMVQRSDIIWVCAGSRLFRTDKDGLLHSRPVHNNLQHHFQSVKGALLYKILVKRS